MKKKIFKRTLSALLAVVMVFLMIPFSVFVINADEYIQDERIEKYRLDAINGKLSNQELFNYIEQEFNTDRINVTTEKTVLQKNLTATKTTLKIAAAATKMIGNFIAPGAGTIAGGAVGAVGDMAGSFVEKESIEQLEEAIGDLSIQLEGVSAQIAAMTAENRTNLNHIQNYWTNQNAYQAYAGIIKEFSSPKDGNDRFGQYRDYYSWREKLHTVLKGLLAEQTRENYDDLYEISILSDQLYSYLMPVEGNLPANETLQELLYRYILLKGKSGEYANFSQDIEMCTQYVLDWYSTYELAQMCLTMCHIYQANEVLKAIEPELITDSTSYYTENGTRIYFNSEIKAFLEDPHKNTNAVKAELAKFFARILALDESFLYHSGDANITDNLLYYVQYQEIFSEPVYLALTVTKWGEEEGYTRVNNTVSPGDELYLNSFPEILTKVFNPSLITYRSSDETIATVSNQGEVVVGDKYGEVTLYMLYDGKEVYHMELKVTSRKLSGGMGSETAPYLITNWDQIKTIADTEEFYNSKNIHFKIVNDICAKGASFSGIPSFNGTFDGNEKKVYGLKSENGNIGGFIRVVNSDAVVKNLILGNSDSEISVYNNYSVLITANSNAYDEVNAGGIAGGNFGFILNCRVEDSYIYSTNSMDRKKDHTIYCHAGGIAAYNYGKIYNCMVNNTYVGGYATTQKDASPAGVVSEVGGISGWCPGEVIGCEIYDNYLYVYSYSRDSSWSNAGRAIVRSGVVAGCSDSRGQIKENYATNVAFEWHVDGDKSEYLVQEWVACPNGATLTDNRIERKSQTPTPDSSPSTGGLAMEDITEYYENEVFYKYMTYKTGVAPEYREETIHQYPISTHRLNVENRKVIILTPISGTTMYQKTQKTISIIPKAIEELLIYNQPNEDVVEVQNHIPSFEGLKLAAMYNDGTVILLDEEAYFAQYSFATEGKVVATFTFDGKSVSITKDVEAMEHELPDRWTDLNATQHKKNCQICDGSVYENHVYGDCLQYSSSQHKRICMCGRIEYFDHNWNEGVSDGSDRVIYTCTDCGATKTGTVIGNHTFGDWTNKNSLRHQRVCLECGEIEQSEHNWDEGTVTKEATCKETGTLRRTCIDCHTAIKNETIPKTHRVNTWTYHTSTRHKGLCISCGGLQYADHQLISVSGYNETTHSGICICGNTVSVSHDWDEGVVTVAPTHTAEGVLTKHCACGATTTEAIEKTTDHSFGAWTQHNDLQHKHTCGCGLSEYEDHGWSAWTVTVEPTYTTEGERQRSCSSCTAVESEAIDILVIPENAPYITVESKNANVGQTVTVPIILRNNPGVSSMRITVTYNGDVLKLTNVAYNAAMGGQSVAPENIDALDGSVILYWVAGFSDYTEDCVFATLTFAVSDEAVSGESTVISVDYDEEDIFDAEEENVTFFCEEGIISFRSHIPGDINGDGSVTTKDVTRLMKYLADWDVEVNEAALDVNGDGQVTTKDTTRLMKYLAGWGVDIY